MDGQTDMRKSIVAFAILRKLIKTGKSVALFIVINKYLYYN